MKITSFRACKHVHVGPACFVNGSVSDKLTGMQVEKK